MDRQQILRLAAARRYAATGTGRAIRKTAKLSQQEIADAVGVTLPTVGRWESGQRAPRGEAGIRWAELLTDLEKMLSAGAAA